MRTRLRLAREVGLLVPRTCITNDPAVARRFVAEVGRAAREPFRGQGIEGDVDDVIVSAPDCGHHVAAAVRRFRRYVPHVARCGWSPSTITAGGGSSAAIPTAGGRGGSRTLGLPVAAALADVLG